MNIFNTSPDIECMPWWELLANDEVDGVSFRPGDIVVEHCIVRCVQVASMAIIAPVVGAWAMHGYHKHPLRPVDIYRMAEVCGMASMGSTILGVAVGVGSLTVMSKDWDAMEVRRRYILLKQNRHQDLQTQTAARGMACGVITTVMMFNGGPVYRVFSGIGLGAMASAVISWSDFDRTMTYQSPPRLEDFKK